MKTIVIPNGAESYDIAMESDIPEAKLRNRFEKSHTAGANTDSSTSPSTSLRARLAASAEDGMT